MTRGDVPPLQEVLAALHAVVYGYGVAGARLAGPDRTLAVRRWEDHRQVRDEISAQVSRLGGAPEQTAAAYAVPFEVATDADARTLATVLEERLAAVWADAVPLLSGEQRRRAVDGLRDTAVAAARWRGGSVPFPGLPERSSG